MTCRICRLEKPEADEIVPGICHRCDWNGLTTWRATWTTRKGRKCSRVYRREREADRAARSAFDRGCTEVKWREVTPEPAPMDEHTARRLKLKADRRRAGDGRAD